MKGKIKAGISALAVVGMVLGSILIITPEVKAEEPAGKFFLTNTLIPPANAVNAAIIREYELTRAIPTGEEDQYAEISTSTPGLSWSTYFRVTVAESFTITGDITVTFWVKTGSTQVILSPEPTETLGSIMVTLHKNNTEKISTGYYTAGANEVVMEPETIYQFTIILPKPEKPEYNEFVEWEDTLEVRITIYCSSTAPQTGFLKFVLGSTAHPSHIAIPGLLSLEGEAEGNIKLLCGNNAKNIQAGGTVTYDITVKNEGTTEETVNLSAYNAPEGWTASLDKPSVTLAGGESENVVLTVGAPSGAEEGTKASITVTGTYSGGGVASVVTTTTVVSAGTRTYGVELSVSPAFGEADKGKQASYTVTVKNTGSAEDTITLSTSSEKGWEVSINPTSLTLASGESKTATLTVKVPATATEGDKDTTTITATCGDGSTYKKTVQTTVKAGAGEEPKGGRFIPGFEGILLIAGIGIASYLIRKRRY